MKRLSLFSLLAILLFACQTGVEPSQTAHQDHFFKLAAPIYLNVDSTQIHLHDYLEKVSESTTVSFLGESIVVDFETGTAVIHTIPPHPISALHITHDGVKHTIPVFSNTKLSFDFVFETDASFTEVGLAGSLNGWNAKATPLERNKSNWSTELLLAPGRYEYQLEVDGQRILDPNNPDQKSNGMGGFNSVLTVGNPDASRPTIRAFSATPKEIIFKGTSRSRVNVWWENQLLVADTVMDETGLVIALPEGSRELKRSHLRAYCSLGELRGNDLLLPMEHGELITSASQLTRNDWHAANMYFVLIDRFADGDSLNNYGVNDPEILPIANHFGGDLKGVHERLNDGYFDDLGVNTIWVSPITTNADGAWGLWDKEVRSKFSGYHGYWPVRSREVDRNFGDSTTLAHLIDALHEKDKNLIVDYVANHVHEEHPIYQRFPEWATPLYLPDGRMNTELWDEHRLTTWFDTFLPTLDFENEAVIEALTDTAMYWVKNFEIDGFRHDATKHIPTPFWRTLTREINLHLNESQSHRELFQIGETYGSPELIGSYVSSGLLDAQFDFNLYDAAVSALANENIGFVNLGRVLRESLETYGSHHLMGNISGNQDRARFISYADGSVLFDEDSKLAGWTREITNKGGDSYDKLIALHALNLSIPGVPCVYYGDEIALPGGNDPDNRRMMVFTELNADQQRVRDAFSALSHLRSNRMSLMYGATDIVIADHNQFIIERTYLQETTRLVIQKAGNYKLPQGWEVLHSSVPITENGTFTFTHASHILLGRID